MSDENEYDKILFDGGNQFILEYYEKCKKYDPSNFNEYNKLDIISYEIKNNLFFEVESTPIRYVGFNGQYRSRTISYMFKKYKVIINQEQAGPNELQLGCIKINICKHNIPTHILFSIRFYSNINIYNNHPEYFMSNIEKNISEQLETIQKDKVMIIKEKESIKLKQNELDKLILENKDSIKLKQNELDELILENQRKINHYASLEQQIIEIQKEKELIKEEKRKISIAKDKLSQRKRDLDDDKFKFELEKDRINDFDIDKFIT